MAGAVAANPHEGSRSEVLADYLFSGWGTVTPVRRQDDYGVDLYCTLTERARKRAIVTDYFVVQVKSTMGRWLFRSRQAVKWLVEYPTPLFLACIEKKEGVLHLYHVMPRFYTWVMGDLPSRLELRPENSEEGTFIRWENGKSFSLSAPIIRVSIADLIDKAKMDRLRKVFSFWVRFDRENCDLIRHGLLRFRMPDRYRVNEIPRSFGELGNASPPRKHLRRGIVTAAEGTECVGGQLARLGDLQGALFAALFVDHLQRTYADMFAEMPRWRVRLPADLGKFVRDGLNKAVAGKPPASRYHGIETVISAIMKHPLVKRYLGRK